MSRQLCVWLGLIMALGAITPAQAAPTPQPPGHTLTVTVAGAGSGTVSSGDASIACPPTCSHFYMSTGPVTITATPAAGSTFSGWSGSCSGSAPTCTLSMTSNQAVTATFTKGGSPPPVAPNCTLRLASTRVLLAAPRSKPAQRRRVGKVTLRLRCDQTVSATLTVKVVEIVPGAHRHRVTFHLIRHYTLRGGHTRTVTLTLWRGALRGLKRHHRETIAVSLQGPSATAAWGVGISARLKGAGG